MSEIDIERLAKVGLSAYMYGALTDLDPHEQRRVNDEWSVEYQRQNWTEIARAMVAALRDQGLVIIPRTDLEWLYAREQGLLKLAYMDGPRWQRIKEALVDPTK